MESEKDVDGFGSALKNIMKPKKLNVRYLRDELCGGRVMDCELNPFAIVMAQHSPIFLTKNSS